MNTIRRCLPAKTIPARGISDKTAAVLKAWRRFYRVGVSERITDYPAANILVVEPLWFKLRGGLHDELRAPDIEEAVREYEQYDAEFKILYLSEFSFLKIPSVYRQRILDALTVATSNCAFQLYGKQGREKSVVQSRVVGNGVAGYHDTSGVGFAVGG